MKAFRTAISGVALAAALPMGPIVAHAQGSAAALMEEVVVTARKRTGAESVQDVPLSVTALGAEQLDVKHVRDLAGLGYGLPNVSMDAGGTFKGTANFSIRGLGVNASVPTLEPSVGVFVDGMYLGINAGVLMDIFDLEQIEVLRGPQGLLFGKNVTGGAVLISTKRPSKTFTSSGKFGVETGPSWTGSGSVSGPINDVVSAKLAAYFNKDEGYFLNRFDNKEFGKQKTYLIRPVIELQPTEALNLILRAEYGKQDGDGAAGQNHAFFSRHSFDFHQNAPAYNHSRWTQLVGQGDLDVGFGDGKVTNIAGYRHFRQAARVDTDASPADVSDSYTYVEQEQFSNELRYAGTFGRVDVTTGVYYFTQQINYQDNRRGTGGSLFVYSGGFQDSDAYAAFSAVDFRVSEAFTINAGLRYSYEKKEISVATQPINTYTGANAVGRVVDIIPSFACDVMARRCNFDFNDDNSWEGLTPKIGFQWRPAEDTQIYGFWTRGFRGGGYNIRSGSLDIPPGPFDDEVQSSFELGNKSQLLDRRLRFNNAIFYNKIKDLQRSIILPDPRFNTVTLIRNTANATVWGVESDLQFLVTPNFVVFASVGYTHGKYTTIKFDLTGDRAITARDLALKLPRLSPWTGSVGFTYDYNLPDFGNLAFSADYSYRDKSFYNDSNTGFLNKTLMLNGNISLTPAEGAWSLSVYGKNLLNETQFAGVTPIGGPAGSTFSPLEKGRIVGVEMKLEY